jgi:hypothetical protein
MAIVGDKLKLTNYSYELVPKNNIGSNTEILTNGEYSLVHNGSNRRWDEKVVDAFDIDWNPYELHFTDDNVNEPVIKIKTTDDLINAINRSMAYTANSYASTYAYQSSYSVWANVAYYIDNLATYGIEVPSDLHILSDMKYTYAYNTVTNRWDMRITYTYNYKPGIFVSTPGTLSSVTLGKYSEIFNDYEGNINAGGDYNHIEGSNNTITNSSYSHIDGVLNSISNSAYIDMHNARNRVSLSYNISVSGYNTSVSGVRYSSIFSVDSSVSNASNIFAGGTNNNISLTDHSVIFGDKNTSDTVKYATIFGYGHTMSYNSYSTLIGMNNMIDHAYGDNIIGNSNKLSGNGTIQHNNIIGSYNNFHNMSYSTVIGNNNYRAGFTKISYSSIIGNNNHIDDFNNSVELGSYNYSYKSLYSLHFGRENYSYYNNDSLLGGRRNKSYNSANIVIFGENNYNTNSHHTNIFGTDNNVKYNNHSNISGISNISYNTYYSNINGNYTNAYTTKNTNINGNYISLSYGYFTNIYGSNLRLINAYTTIISASNTYAYNVSYSLIIGKNIGTTQNSQTPSYIDNSLILSSNLSWLNFENSNKKSNNNVIIGDNNVIANPLCYSFIFGRNNTLIEHDKIALNENNVVTYSSIVIGTENTTGASYQTLIGHGLDSTAPYSVVLGRYNDSKLWEFKSINCIHDEKEVLFNVGTGKNRNSTRSSIISLNNGYTYILNAYSYVLQAHYFEAPNITYIQYTDLVSKITNNKLLPGRLYRITDYKATTTKTNTSSTGVVYNIITLAISTNQLSEDAWFIDGTNVYNIKYDVNNSTSKYDWADSTNGKGVIYYMKDNKNNILPYDFISIKIKNNLSLSGNCSNVEVKPTISKNGKYSLMFTSITNSTNIVISSESNNITINECYYINIGLQCNTITINRGSHINVNENNTHLTIEDNSGSGDYISNIVVEQYAWRNTTVKRINKASSDNSLTVFRGANTIEQILI